MTLLTDAQITEIRARTYLRRRSDHIPDLMALLADRDELVRRLAAPEPSQFLIHTDDCPHSRACACGLTAQVVTKESHPEVWAKLQPPKVPLATLDAWDHAGKRPDEGDSANPTP